MLHLKERRDKHSQSKRNCPPAWSLGPSVSHNLSELHVQTCVTRLGLLLGQVATQYTMRQVIAPGESEENVV